MLKHTRTRMLAAVIGEPGWAHPYSDPFTCYSDGGDSDGGQGDDADGGDDGGNGDDGDADGDDDGDQGDGKDDDPDDTKLGEKGVKALRELRRENRRLKAQLRQQGNDDGGRKQSAKDDGQGDDDPEAIRERAREEARAEVWNERVEAAAIAAAAIRFSTRSIWKLPPSGLRSTVYRCLVTSAGVYSLLIARKAASACVIRRVYP